MYVKFQEKFVDLYPAMNVARKGLYTVPVN